MRKRKKAKIIIFINSGDAIYKLDLSLSPLLSRNRAHRRCFIVSRPFLGSSPATEALVGSSSPIVFWIQVFALASRHGSWTGVGSSLASSLVLFWAGVLFVTQSPLEGRMIVESKTAELKTQIRLKGSHEDNESQLKASREVLPTM
ncbi:uncharacterized protein LOC107485753 [Arachis duranensis]|uniref:Uncharacterized protein LOC107485753 n=1 Tax=Arachis duranensis TaxID=130453 RepID=A0A9C6TTE9_ARADU|nr:uncharacterized protein LOC107485753 [Arachis duranensis]